jgi:hypothetical protein
VHGVTVMLPAGCTALQESWHGTVDQMTAAYAAAAPEEEEEEEEEGLHAAAPVFAVQ